MNDHDPAAPAPRANLSDGPLPASPAPPRPSATDGRPGSAAGAGYSGASPGAEPNGRFPGSNPAAGSGFDFNRPTIISLLYLAAPFVGVTGIAGVVLSYVWKSETHADWETSHYDYLARTFWIFLIGTVASVVLMLFLVGFVTIIAVGVLVLVRCLLSIVNAQKQQPMPNPNTLLA